MHFLVGRESEMHLIFRKNGRGGWIRTNGPLLPKQMRYQAALRPDMCGLPRPIARMAQ
jgi:hypothetical protein